MTDGPKSVKNKPVAQYIRMSNEHQRFSPDNQMAANAAFALEHGYEIVATYQDLGKSGLTLKARPALKRLLSDVLSGTMPYKAVLVLDVSRWGRFQDADQAAHYEYLCREAGIPVRYCCEAFDNDGGAMASIVKHMKRVMAAEYSRDLSIKIARAQRQQAKLGYKQGGTAPFGTRRLVIDENGKPRMTLMRGQYKALSTDKVVFVRGPKVEVTVVRRIFVMYCIQHTSFQEIVEWLVRKKIAQPNGNPFDRRAVANLLRNEIYLGTYVFGRVANNLGRTTRNPQSQWVRTTVMDSIVSQELFRLSAARLAREMRPRAIPEAEIKKGLERLLREKGYISGALIDACKYLPSQSALSRRFGGLKKACQLIGHRKATRASNKHVRDFSDDDLVVQLRRIHAANGILTKRLIDVDEGTPSSSHFMRRLGGFEGAYKRAGLCEADMPQRHLQWKKSIAFTEEDLLEGLRAILARRGYITLDLINAEPTVPNISHYVLRFGSLYEAYARIGYLRSASEVHLAAWARRKKTPN